MSEIIRAPSSDFPSDVLKWMKANAKPKMALKFMKCHKYFQHQTFPYLVVKELGYIDTEDKWFYYTLDNQAQQGEGVESIENIPKKLWILEDLSLSKFPNLSSRLFPKIAVCDVEGLKLRNQMITFNEFKFLTASGNVDFLFLRDVKINFENGDPVVVPDILKCVPKLKNFYFYNNRINIFPSNFADTFKEIDASKLETFALHMTSYPLFLIFSKFIKQNPHIKYLIFFREHSLSSEETQNLTKDVQKIIDSDTEYPIPEITFPRQPQTQIDALNKKLRNECLP